MYLNIRGAGREGQFFTINLSSRIPASFFVMVNDFIISPEFFKKLSLTA